MVDFDVVTGPATPLRLPSPPRPAAPADKMPAPPRPVPPAPPVEER